MVHRLIVFETCICFKIFYCEQLRRLIIIIDSQQFKLDEDPCLHIFKHFVFLTFLVFPNDCNIYRLFF